MQPIQVSVPTLDDDESDLLAQLPASVAFDPLEELSRQDVLTLLDRALGTLPQGARQLVEMCYLRELPHAEVAERLRITSGTLDTRLHRARRQLRQIFSGPLREEAQGFGLALDETLAEGWQQTRLWCPRCLRQHLQGCFMHADAADGPNLHLRCPDCSRRYGQDTVHSMGLVPVHLRYAHCAKIPMQMAASLPLTSSFASRTRSPGSFSCTIPAGAVRPATLWNTRVSQLSVCNSLIWRAMTP